MATGFIIKDFDCDFVVVVKLNRGSKDGVAKFFRRVLFASQIVKLLGKGFSRVSFRNMPNFKS